MSQKQWQVTNKMFCERVAREIRLETQVVYPADHLPDQPPRVLAHRCSNAIECNKLEKMACVYSATNPDYIPT